MRYTLDNNVRSTVSASISESSTSITLVDAAAPFRNPPAPVGGIPGVLTLTDSISAPTVFEIVTYSGVTNNGNGTRTLTGVIRAQEGTTARAWASGSQVFQSLTAATVTLFRGTVAITGGTITGLSSPLPVASGGTGANTAANARVALGLAIGTDVAAQSHVGATGAAHGVATTSVNGFMSTAHVAKLDGIAANANNYVHPNHSGDVSSTGDGATTINNGVVTNAKLANVATGILKGRTSAGSGSVEDLSAAQVRALLNVADGANNYVHPTGDGWLHVPATGTTNNGRVLTAGATAGALLWVDPLRLTSAVTGAALAASGAVGTSTDAARADHVHPFPTAANIGAIATTHPANAITAIGGSPVNVGASSAAGTSTAVARADHVHGHGDQAGGSLHAVATTVANGFMSTAHVTKLDGIQAGAQVNVPTNLAMGGSGDNRTITSSTGMSVTLDLASGSAAGLMSMANFTKLAGIAVGATVNSTDAFLRSRANHTGTQLASTISDFSTSVRSNVGGILLNDTRLGLRKQSLSGGAVIVLEPVLPRKIKMNQANWAHTDFSPGQSSMHTFSAFSSGTSLVSTGLSSGYGITINHAASTANSGGRVTLNANPIGTALAKSGTVSSSILFSVYGTDHTVYAGAHNGASAAEPVNGAFLVSSGGSFFFRIKNQFGTVIYTSPSTPVVPGGPAGETHIGEQLRLDITMANSTPGAANATSVVFRLSNARTNTVILSGTYSGTVPIVNTTTTSISAFRPTSVGFQTQMVWIGYMGQGGAIPVFMDECLDGSSFATRAASSGYVEGVDLFEPQSLEVDVSTSSIWGNAAFPIKISGRVVSVFGVTASATGSIYLTENSGGFLYYFNMGGRSEDWSVNLAIDVEDSQGRVWSMPFFINTVESNLGSIALPGFGGGGTIGGGSEV